MANELALTGMRDTEIPAPGARTMEEITAEAIRHQMEGADAIIGLGNCLMEAKAQLQHGEWLSWLADNLNLSERSAQELMRIARNCSNPRALADLGKKKVLSILTLPPAERELFLDGDYVPEGADKSVSDMTTRELQQVIKERDDTQEQLEYTQSKLASANKRIGKLSDQLDKAHRAEEKARAKASSAEESRLKMAEDMRHANNQLELVKAELEELRNRPTDVAIQYERDEEAIEEARQEVRAEMQSALDEANAAQRKADEERKAAEDALESAKASAKAELQEVNAQLDAARKAAKVAAVNSDKDLATFDVCFVQAQELADKMRKAFLAIREKDPATAEKLVNAVQALQGVIGGITA